MCSTLINTEANPLLFFITTYYLPMCLLRLKKSWYLLKNDVELRFHVHNSD